MAARTPISGQREGPGAHFGGYWGAVGEDWRPDGGEGDDEALAWRGLTGQGKGTTRRLHARFLRGGSPSPAAAPVRGRGSSLEKPW